MQILARPDGGATNYLRLSAILMSEEYAEKSVLPELENDCTCLWLRPAFWESGAGDDAASSKRVRGDGQRASCIFGPAANATPGTARYRLGGRESWVQGERTVCVVGGGEQGEVPLSASDVAPLRNGGKGPPESSWLGDGTALMLCL